MNPRNFFSELKRRNVQRDDGLALKLLEEHRRLLREIPPALMAPRSKRSGTVFSLIG